MQGVPVVNSKKQRLPACVGVDQPEVPATGRGDRVGGDRDQLDERRWCPEQPLVAGGVRQDQLQDAPVSRRGDDVTAPGDRIAASETPHSSHSTPRRSRSRPMPAGGSQWSTEREQQASLPHEVTASTPCRQPSTVARPAGQGVAAIDHRAVTSGGSASTSPRGLGFLPRARLGSTSADRPLTRSPRCPVKGTGRAGASHLATRMSCLRGSLSDREIADGHQPAKVMCSR